MGQRVANRGFVPLSPGYLSTGITSRTVSAAVMMKKVFLCTNLCNWVMWFSNTVAPILVLRCHGQA